MDKISYDMTRKSRPVVIVPYKEEWPVAFQNMGERLRTVLSTCALRIDHIGSTSVPGLGAKDVIDIQVTVQSLDDMDTFRSRMYDQGFRRGAEMQYDSYCGADDADALEWRKCYFREPNGEQRTHIHVREEGRLNQRYALLFRDFLRVNTTVRDAYEIIKQRLSEVFPESIEGYLYIKDPLMDIIFEAASLWAKESGWKPDAKFL